MRPTKSDLSTVSLVLSFVSEMTGGEREDEEVNASCRKKGLQCQGGSNGDSRSAVPVSPTMRASNLDLIAVS